MLQIPSLATNFQARAEGGHRWTKAPTIEQQPEVEQALQTGRQLRKELEGLIPDKERNLASHQPNTVAARRLDTSSGKLDVFFRQDYGPGRAPDEVGQMRIQLEACPAGEPDETLRWDYFPDGRETVEVCDGETRLRAEKDQGQVVGSVAPVGQQKEASEKFTNPVTLLLSGGKVRGPEYAGLADLMSPSIAVTEEASQYANKLLKEARKAERVVAQSQPTVAEPARMHYSYGSQQGLLERWGLNRSHLEFTRSDGSKLVEDRQGSATSLLELGPDGQPAFRQEVSAKTATITAGLGDQPWNRRG